MMLIKYITLISGFNHLVFALILLLKKSPIKKANSILGITFLIMTLYCFQLYYLYSAYSIQSHTLMLYYIPFDYLLQLLMGPAIFIYLKTILNQKYSFRSYKIWLHVIPTIPALAFIIYFMLLPTDLRIEKIQSNFNESMWQMEALNGLFYVQMTSYLVVCYLIIRKQVKVSIKVLINSIHIDIQWLKTFFTIDLAIMISTAPIIFIASSEKMNIIVSLTAMNIQFIYIFIKSVWQTGVIPVEKIQVDKKHSPSLKIADNLTEQYFNNLIEHFKTKKPFLNSNCSIQRVSQETNIPLHHLSHVLNNKIKQNFSEFINEYRVKHAKQILNSEYSKRITIEAIALDCGYGSKTSFNRSFKKHTNLTPSEYRNKIVNN